MAFVMILFPLTMAAIAAAIPFNRLRPWLLPITAAAHLSTTVFVLTRPDLMATTAWLVLDPPARIVLLVISMLFFFCSFYTVSYLRHRQERSNRVFCACFLGFLGIMSLVTWSHHLGLMWVAIEATTLVSAPLIYFEHTTRSIEATWKYLMVCSVGIALGLLGTFFLAYSSLYAGLESTLTLEGLLQHAPQLSKPWLHAAFLLLLVGYGTKMGLAPMHTWLPEAHSEAPSPISAMLSGALLPCAFLAILRIYHICLAAGEGAFVSRPLLGMGLFSMAVACVFLVGQRDFKRMLAYSSVEHMGILAIGLGIGVPALFGTMLHVLVHGLTKGVLFLSAGNIYHAYGSKTTDKVYGAMRRLPLSGTLFLAGFLAITGSPPFGPFISEFAILNGAFNAGRFVTAGLYLFLLLAVFIGMGTIVLRVVQGRAPTEVRNTPYRDSLLTAAPAVILLGLVLLLGLYIPTPLNALLNDAVHFLENRP
jgi:hydrogenase-4 component F